MGVTVDIDQALKDYAGKYDQKLIGQLLYGLSFVKDLTFKPNVKTALNLTKFEAKHGFRPLNTAVETAKNPGRKYSGRKLQVRGGMKIFEIIPEELRETWMGEMLDPNATDVPFAPWVWTQEFATLAEEIHDAFYFAEYHADAAAFDSGDTYASGDFVNFENNIFKANDTTTAGQSPTSTPAKWDNVDADVVFDGPGTIIAAEITAGNLTNVITTGAITSTNGVASLQAVSHGAPIKVRNKGLIQYISFGSYENYIADHNTRYGSGNGVGGSDLEENPDGVYLKGSARKVFIKPVTWMGDSGRVIQTFKANMLVGGNIISDANKIGKKVETLHGFKAITKFLLGFNVADLEVLYVNDQA